MRCSERYVLYTIGCFRPVLPPFGSVADYISMLPEEANKTFNALLKSELFGSTSYHSASNSLDNTYLGPSPSTSRYAAGNPPVSAAAAIPTTPTRTKNLFSYNSPARQHESGSGSRNGSGIGLDSPAHEKYSASPVRYESQRMLLSPRKTPRALSKVPFKVLDAPELAVREKHCR